MKTAFIAFLILSACFIAKAQNTQTDNSSLEEQNAFEYGCSPNDGHIDFVEDGKVIKVIDYDTVIFKSNKGISRRVNLLGVDSKSNKKNSKSFLEGNVLNLETQLIFSSGQFKKSKVIGIISIEEKPVNQLMIEQGLARYREPEPYKISSYNACVFQKSEEKAKQEKLGIWAK